MSCLRDLDPIARNVGYRRSLIGVRSQATRFVAKTVDFWGVSENGYRLLEDELSLSCTAPAGIFIVVSCSSNSSR